MAANHTDLDTTLDEHGADGYLFDDHNNADQYYLSGFDAPDPFISCYTPDGIHLLVSGLEYGRAQNEADAASVARLGAYDHRDRIDEYGPQEGRARVVAEFLADRDIGSVLVGARFPAGTADGLRDQGLTVTVDEDGAVGELRAVKSDEEVEHIREAQRANEAAMARAEELLDGAAIEDGTLVHEGEPLTSERIKQAIEIELLRHNCALDETIVACGADAADPHDRGSGPIEAGETVIIDIFPKSKDTRYHADMTRTFVRGEPAETAREWYDLTHEAYTAALDALEPGVTGAEVHDAVCDVYADAGEPTLRDDPEAETGFIHGTGHGIGLEVHESPSVSIGADTELKPGHVVTIEPGLYDPAIGGVRIEDLVVVTEDGYENLAEYPIEFELD